jgi:hypothetical protein
MKCFLNKQTTSIQVFMFAVFYLLGNIFFNKPALVLKKYGLTGRKEEVAFTTASFFFIL